MPRRTDLRACAPWDRPNAPRAWVARVIVAVAAIALAGCHAARVLAPNPPLRAASAALYAIDVEFAEPLDRASAEDPAHYVLYPATTPAAHAVIASATLVDTLYGRVVQLLVPDWFGDDTKDHLDVVVESHDVRALGGRSTGDRSASFRTGLEYEPSMRSLLDARCTGCHDPAHPNGNYRTDRYASLLENGSSPPANLIPGDPNCLLVRRCKPRNSMFNLAGLSYLDFEMLHNWVVSYTARP